MLKIEQLITCLATTAYVCATVRVTIFSAGVKFQLVSNFTELHTLTRAARSYALLALAIMSLLLEAEAKFFCVDHACDMTWL